MEVEAKREAFPQESVNLGLGSVCGKMGEE